MIKHMFVKRIEDLSWLYGFAVQLDVAACGKKDYADAYRKDGANNIDEVTCQRCLRTLKRRERNASNNLAHGSDIGG